MARRGRKNLQDKQRTQRAAMGVGAGVVVAVVLAIALMDGLGGSAQAAPAWETTTTDGETLSSGALEGEVYALDFFFLSCSICQIQLPENRKMVEALAARDDFTFISVTADPSDTVPLIEEHRQEKNATWPHARDTTGIYAKFEVRGNPNIVFVDRDGNVALTVRELAKGEYLIEQAQRLLDGKAPIEPAANDAQAPADDAAHPTG